MSWYNPLLTYTDTQIITPLPIDGSYLGSSSNPFPDTNTRNAAYPVSPALRTTVYVGAPGTVPTCYEYVGPGTDDTAWVAMPTPRVGGGVETKSTMIDNRGVLAPIYMSGYIQPYDRVNRKRVLAVCGSSTMEKVFQANRPNGSTAQPMTFAANGFLGFVQMLHGSPFAIAKGGALGKGSVLTGPSTTTDTVCWQIDQALLLSPKITDIVIAAMGNDDLSVVSVDQVWEWTRSSIMKCLKAGVRVWNVFMHMKTSTGQYKDKYLDFQSRSRLLASLFPGQIINVDHFSSVLDPVTGLTNPSFLDATGVHLNLPGSRQVARVAWTAPLRMAGLANLSVDPETYGTLISSNPRFLDSTGAFSLTGWTGSAGFSTIIKGPDVDPFGYRSVRVTQLVPGTTASLRQTFTPVGTSGNIGRLVFSAKAVANCRVFTCSVRNSSASWSATDLSVSRDGDTSSEFLANGVWYNYVSAELELDSTFFAANSQINIQANQLAGDQPAVFDVSCAALIKTSDTWPT